MINNSKISQEKKEVYVVSIEGKPLMPCKKSKAKKLLKQKQGIIEKFDPFTIGLNFQSEEKIEPIVLGIDPGETIGIVAITETTGEILFAGQAKIRAKDLQAKEEGISELLTLRRSYRRGRRNRNTLYREARWRNRKPQGVKLTIGVLEEFVEEEITGSERINSLKKIIGIKYKNTGTIMKEILNMGFSFKLEWGKKIKPYVISEGNKDWRPVSIKARHDAILNLVKIISSILPISKIRCEVAQFDTQKMVNPNIEGKEYQNGQMKDYRDNVREYVMLRDKWECHYKKLRPDIPCSGKKELEHIHPKSDGGTYNPANLVCSCKAHNDAKGTKSYKEFTGKKFKAPKGMKETVFMNCLKDFLIPELNTIAPTEITYGFFTRRQRNQRLNLPHPNKSHIVDAIAITGIIPREMPTKIYKIKQRRTKNRALHKANAQRWISYKLTEELINKVNNAEFIKEQLLVNSYEVTEKTPVKVKKEISKETFKQLTRLTGRTFYKKQLQALLKNAKGEEIEAIIKKCKKIESKFSLKPGKETGLSKKRMNLLIQNLEIPRRDKEFLCKNKIQVFHRTEKIPNRNQEREISNVSSREINEEKWFKGDKVFNKVLNKTCFISGFASNYFYLKDIEGKAVKLSESKRTWKVEDLKFICHNNGWLWELVDYDWKKDCYETSIKKINKGKKGQQDLFPSPTID